MDAMPYRESEKHQPQKQNDVGQPMLDRNSWLGGIVARDPGNKKSFHRRSRAIQRFIFIGVAVIIYFAGRMSYELDPPRRKQDHLEQEPAMFPPADIRGAVGAFPVANRHLHDL